MKVQFTGRHFDASENLQGNIEESLKSMVRFNDQAQDAKVVLDMAPNGLRIASVQVSIAHHGVVAASAEAETMHKAVDLMLEKLERLLKKENEKAKEHRAPAVDQVVIP
jgi:ribosomal subunit interface protein